MNLEELNVSDSRIDPFMNFSWLLESDNLFPSHLHEILFNLHFTVFSADMWFQES